MKLKNLFSLSTIILSLLGAGLLLFPSPLISMRTGLVPAELTLHIARQFGILALALAFISWRMRLASPSKERSSIVLALTLTFSLLPIETAFSIFKGSESGEGWILVTIFALLALGFITSKD